MQTLLPQASLLRSDSFFSGAVCFVRRTLARSAFHRFSIGFQWCKGVFSQRRISVNLVDLVKSFKKRELFKRVFNCKHRLRYSREWASQSLPNISQKFTLRKKVRINVGTTTRPRRRSGPAPQARAPSAPSRSSSWSRSSWSGPRSRPATSGSSRR